MATLPTVGEMDIMLQSTVAWYEKLRLAAAVDANSLIVKENTLEDDVGGDYGTSIFDSVRIGRTRVGDALNTWPSAMDNIIRAYGQVIGVSSPNIESIWAEIFQYWIDNSKTIDSREFSFPAVTADANNVGDGTIRRLNVDKHGFEIEAAIPELKQALCVQDELSGAPRHEEVFRFKGQPVNIDSLVISGSGGELNIAGLSARSTARLLQNPSFSEFAGTLAAPTSLTGWTVAGDIANLQLSEADVYRDFLGDTTPRKLIFETNEKISQAFNETRALSRVAPYYMQIAWRRVSSADGTLTIRCGSNNTNVDVTTGTNGVWNVLFLPLDENLYFDNFNEANLDIEIELASNTTGTLEVDDLIFSPMTGFMGGWYALIGGATTFKTKQSSGSLPDRFSWTDSAAADGIISRWLMRRGLYLPAVSGGTETVADPTI